MSAHDIHKASGILLQDRKVLVTRSRGKENFVHPGGKLEQGETPKQALVRELKEELNIDVAEADLEPFLSASAAAADTPDVQVHMDVFSVLKYSGVIAPSSEIEEIAWVNSRIPVGMQLGSIMLHETIPRLKELDLID